MFSTGRPGLSLGTRPLLLASAGLLAFVLIVAAAAISVFATPGEVETQPQVGSGENRLFVPGLVANAEGTYAPFPTATPAPTVVGVQDAPNRLFVATRGDDAGEGTRDDPFETIAHALEVARDVESPEVYVSTGIYAEPIEIIDHSVELHGGYSFDWQRLDGEYTIVQPTSAGSPGANALVVADSDNVHVEGFALTNGSEPLAEPMELSRITVRIEQSSGVILTDNHITSTSGSDAPDGRHGDDGDGGGDGATGDDQGVCPPTPRGGAGGDGAVSGGRGGDGSNLGGDDGENGSGISVNIHGGAGGSGGAFAGGAGRRGGDGDDGTSVIDPGDSGGPVGFFGLGGYEPADGEDGVSSNRTAGAGGGGGGGEAGAFVFFCGGGGGGGGGGGWQARSDGTGGRAGGASFGIFILDSEVEVADNEITTANGGDGGDGGDAGTGGSGGDGGFGGVGSAGDGGDGGRGAHSAPGGGGGGGPSIGIIAGGRSSVEFGENTFNIGQGGEGGLGGLYGASTHRPSRGETGLRVEYYDDTPVGLPEPPEPTN